MDHPELAHFLKNVGTALPNRREVFRRPCERRVTYPAIRFGAAVLLSLLVVGSIAATGAVAQDLQPPQHPSSIRGTVINAVTGEPISRALIYSTDNRFARMTDGEGHFDYPIPQAVDDQGSPGNESQGHPQFTTCCLQARKPGFLNDPNQGVEIALGSEPTIALMPEGLIRGRVSLPSSDAAIGIGVEIYSRQVQEGTFHWVMGASVRANSNGEFRFAELRPGEYKILTRELMDTDPSSLLGKRQLYGFPPVYFPGAVDFSSATPVELKAGQTFEAPLSPARQPYYPVRIPVAGDVGSAEVTVSVQGHASPGYSLGYSAERHRIEGFLPNGTYLVSMGSRGPNAASGNLSLTVAGGPAQDSRMVLSQNNSIQLNVIDDVSSKDENRTGTWSDEKHSFALHGPRLYLQASLEPIDDLDLRPGRTIRPPAGPDDDKLVIDDVAPGRYRLRLSSGRGYVASATADGVDLLQEPLVVLSGSTPTVEIRLRDDYAEIDGSLINTSADVNAAAKHGYSGSWSPLAYIYFVPQPGSTAQFLQSGADSEGKFVVPNVAPGKYLVLAVERPQVNLPYRDVEAMRIYEPKGQIVRLVPGQKEKLELPIISSAE